jgi:hypothetical protein
VADAVGRRQLAWLIGVLLVFSAATLLVLPRRGESADPRASTLLTTRNGTAALYHTMEDLGLPVARRYTPFVEADPLRGVLVQLAPGSVALSPAERSALIAWVRTGGTLIVVPGAASLFDRLGPALGLGQHLPVLPGGFVAQPRHPARAAEHRWAEGADSVAAAASAFVALPDDLEHEVLIRSDAEVWEDAPVAVVYGFGEGTIVALADQTLVSNRTARDAPGAVQILVRAAADLTAPGDTIWFDEYHHGFAGGGGPVRALLAYLRSTRPGRALLQLTLVAAGLLLLVGRRLGRPRPPAPPRRRSPLEHVEALARVYHRADAQRTARGLLVAGLARRLHEPQAGRDADADALLARLEGHPTRAAPARRLASALAGEAPPAAIAAAIDDVIEPERDP